MNTAITLKDISVHYGNRRALENVSGAFAKGSLTALAGPNGSGKSTLLKIIAGVIRPTHGKVLFADKQHPTIAYLPQASHLQRDFPITVHETVLTGFYPKLGERGRIKEHHRELAHQALHQVGLDGYEKRSINELSGGEFQRMLFARVIIQDAAVILLDEPFTAVDAETTARLIKLLLNWHKEERTVICVLHDLLLIHKYFPESMVLRGKCLGIGHTHQMFDQKLLSFDLDMAQLIPAEEAKKSAPAHDHPHKHDHNHDH